MIRRIGIDLGTSHIRIYVPQKGMVVNEPNVVALNAVSQKVLAVGDEAKAMLGRTPEAIIACYPMSDGVIASYKITKQMLQIYLAKILGRLRLFKPEVIINVPVGATSTEKKAVLDIAEGLGAKKVYLIKSPVAAALGSGIDISSSMGNMIIDVGAGKTEIAVIALGDIVAFSSVRYGGKKMDEAIIDYIRKKRNLIIGEQTAELVKIKIGSSITQKKDLKMEISGSNTISGLPESIICHTNDIAQAVKPVLNEIILAVKQVLQRTPPELSSDVMDKGIVISGDASNLRGFDELMTKITGVPCQMVEEPGLCTIKGIGIAVDNFDQFEESLSWRKN
ncbi:MAG: rod shape-determining protein [Candidatus Berkelbacteria bacterium]|nr:rod shape-determining protein [Candidatus Berkelbacteria bacterium]